MYGRKGRQEKRTDRLTNVLKDRQTDGKQTGEKDGQVGKCTEAQADR
jgi:hypothetical protein